MIPVTSEILAGLLKGGLDKERQLWQFIAGVRPSA